MSLLLDARKKSQQAKSALGGDDSISGHDPGQAENKGSSTSATDFQRFENPRSAGQNLFNAKNPASSFARTGINRNLLIALGGTVLLLSAGAGYVWYSISADNIRPLHPANTPALSKPSPAATPQNNPAPEIVSSQASNASGAGKRPHVSRPASGTPASKNSPLHIDLQSAPIDPLLNDAYRAYRGGKFEQAQQLYREALNLDPRNTDALLGMAVIAQRRGADNEAAGYYSRALMLDPRNAEANAGMTALTTDDNQESHLKNLLNEQQASSSLHFALGNVYAGQARWGDAQHAYANAYRLEPDNSELAFNLAISLDRLGQKNSAAQYYQRALLLDKSNSAGFDHAQLEQRIKELSR